MSGKTKIVVLTGAGMSAESGLKTFRDHDGLWENYRVEEVASIEGWYRKPSLVLDFYNKRRRELFQATPNAGHIAVAGLEQDYEVTVITQNVDNLHEKAGSTRVIHLHGELLKVRSERNEQIKITLSEDNSEIHPGDRAPDGGQLRPDIVWFGEAVPMIEPAMREVENADILLIIGTSLQVYPAAGLLSYAPRHCDVYLIDPNIPSQILRQKIHCIEQGASEGMQTFVNLLKNKQS